MKIYFHLGTTLEENFKKKQKNLHVLQNNVEFLKRELMTYHYSIISAKSLKNCCVLKVLYESLRMIQYELKHVAV
jgi:hypothetical protein